MTDVCNKNNAYPINHLKYKGLVNHGYVSYIKSEKKNRKLTSSAGRNNVVSFEVLSDDWHITNHKPILL